MAVAATVAVTYTCGHTEPRDLSHKPAGERARLAKWYGAKFVCSACFVPEGGGETPQERDARRAAEQAELTAEAARDGLPVDLVGSDKQIGWAIRVRQELFRGAYETLVQTDTLTEDEFTAQVLTAARPLDRARWWIDNRDTAPADLPELLADPGTMGDGATTENHE